MGARHDMEEQDDPRSFGQQSSPAREPMTEPGRRLDADSKGINLVGVNLNPLQLMAAGVRAQARKPLDKALLRRCVAMYT